MRTISIAAFLISVPVASSLAGPAMTSQQAAADVLMNGYSRVALAERAPSGWDVWASKDGIAYEVELDADTGALIKQVPLDTDD